MAAWMDGLILPVPVILAGMSGFVAAVPAPVVSSSDSYLTAAAPAVTAVSNFGNMTVEVLPPVAVDATTLDNNLIAAAVPPVTVSATSEFNSAIISLPAVTADISIPGGLVAQVPAVSVSAEIHLAEVIVVAPAPTLFMGIDGGMVLTAPAPQMFSVLFHPTDVSTPENPYALPFPGWAINYETNAPSRYDSLPVNSVCIFNGKTYMACAAGIYEIGADDDAGRPIHASATVAQTNFGSTKNKRIPYVYVGMRSTGAMQLKAIANNQSDRYYALNAIGGAVRGSRADLGKGLEGQYWQFRVDNVNGADFELDSIEFKPAVLSRHGV